MRFSPLVGSLLFVSSLTTAACTCGAQKKAAPLETAAPVTAEKKMAEVEQPKSLYDRLGGLEAITLVVDDFVNNVAADSRINARFLNTDIPKLKQLLTDQICAATGGTCEYKGKDMVTVHTGMKITDDEFTALVEDLVKSLDKFAVPEAEKGELLGALGGMKGDIVGK